MIRVSIRHVRPDKESKLRAWLQELNARAPEIRESFRAETTRAELAYIIPGSKGPLLIYVMEAEDFTRGGNVYATSQLPIDVKHREVMRECLADPLKESPLYEVALEAGVGT
jgi:hypothetical protein